MDDTDPMIRGSIRFGRINASKSKSFVGRPNEWQDITYGHGTHVTRLLLETAPAAEIYIGKICTGKMVNDEYMPGIAKVGFSLFRFLFFFFSSLRFTNISSKQY